MKIFKRSFLSFFFIICFSSQTESAIGIDLKDFSRAPNFLSEFGFFTDMRHKTPADSVHPYSLASHLLSDHTDKLHIVYVPDGENLSDEESKVVI